MSKALLTLLRSYMKEECPKQLNDRATSRNIQENLNTVICFTLEILCFISYLLKLKSTNPQKTMLFSPGISHDKTDVVGDKYSHRTPSPHNKEIRKNTDYGMNNDLLRCVL